MIYGSLQTLRGLFAIMIFFHHFNFKVGEGGLFDAGGDCGVAFFFILSGFVMSMGYMKKEADEMRREKLAPFIGKRLSKLYPLHLICLVAAIFLNRGISAADISNLFLLQAWVPLQDWYFSGNSVGWCLSDFLFFYAIFPFLCRLMKLHKKGFIRTYIGIILVYGIGMNFIPYDFRDGILYINPLTRLLDFVFGMVLWEYYRERVSASSFRFTGLNLLAGILFLGVTTYIWYAFPTVYNLSLLWWPVTAFILYYAVTSGKELLNINFLVKFGDISFSFYLIHVLCKRYFDIFLAKADLPLDPYFRLIIVFLITVFLSIAIHKYFVLPIEKKIRGVILSPKEKESNNIRGKIEKCGDSVNSC